MGSVQDLMFEMSMAFDAGDANRLAGLYHWTGMSSSNAYAAIERLDRMVGRPLVDIVPVMPAPPDPPTPPPSTDAAALRTGAASPSLSPSPRPGDAGDDDPYVETLARRYAGPPEPAKPASHAATDAGSGRIGAPVPTTLPPAPAPPPQRPVGIKVVQTLTDGVTPTSTVFGLTRHFGCWWIRN